MAVETYDDNFYLCVKKRTRGYQHSLQFRVTTTQPNLEAGEVAIYVTVSLPRTLFQCPMLKANVSVPINSVSPAVIDAEVAENIGQIIREQTGLDIKMIIEAPEQKAA